jgi:hypothetical protein
MASPLVPTVLNFTSDHITAAPPRRESSIRPQISSSSNTHSSIVLGTQDAATTELGEHWQSPQRALLMEEADDNYELKLPKMRSLVIMICTNVLLQVGCFRWHVIARYCPLTSNSNPHRRPSLSLSLLAANMPNTSVAVRHFLDL